MYPNIAKTKNSLIKNLILRIKIYKKKKKQKDNDNNDKKIFFIAVFSPFRNTPYRFFFSEEENKTYRFISGTHGQKCPEDCVFTNLIAAKTYAVIKTMVYINAEDESIIEVLNHPTQMENFLSIHENRGYLALTSLNEPAM
jgi:hypothetical protein